MKKEFNDTGTCFPEQHYIVDTSKKLVKIIEYIEREKYFVINRPRQYGKTTTLQLIKQKVTNSENIVILISFEGIGDDIFKEEHVFCSKFLEILSDNMEYEDEIIAEIIKNHNKELKSFKDLRKEITKIIKEINKNVILLIDEIDKNSNNQLFVNFLAMLRDKYLSRNREATFHSIILAGLHDIKTLKTRLRPEEEAKYNTPWNIAVEFDVDMSFDSEEIETMLLQYVKETGVKMDTRKIAEKLYFYTSGYPYFVSKLCKIIDEKIKPGAIEWQEEDITDSVKVLLQSIGNANFDTVIKSLENSKELSEFIQNTLFGIDEYNFAIQNQIINIAYINGMIKNERGKVRIFNKIYEEYISDYYISKAETSKVIQNTVQSIYLKSDGRLDLEKVLAKFQEVIEEKYSNRDLLKSNEFLEQDLRLLFLVFLKPIINGTGFSFKEVQTSAEKRLDVIVIFLDEKFIIELKMWYGEEYHKQGIEQMKGYMTREHCKEGYMIVMNKNKNKKFEQSREEGIFTVWM